MTFTSAIVTGLGFFTGVLIGWALVFTALLISYGIYKFFEARKSEDDWPDHAVSDNVPDEPDWNYIQNIPAFRRREMEQDYQDSQRHDDDVIPF